MATKVRLFSYSGLVLAHVANCSEQLAFGNHTLLKQSYLAREVMDVGSEAKASDVKLSPSHTRLLRIEVEPGKRVHYEVTISGGDLRMADADSPTLEGIQLIESGSGWRISLMEAK